MIPRAFITEWQARVPWPQPYQVEQDLILSRLMIEIAMNELLEDELVMRGGTCLHKLHLPEPYRYSEDLDYVRRTHSGIKPYVDELREIAARMGLEVHAVERSGQMVHLILDAAPTIPPGRIRIKVETNIVETDFFSEPTTIDHAVESRWWSGAAPIWTFVLPEMMSTKCRALYQRRKGRDLFDLWLVLTREKPDSEKIVAGLRHYMKESVFTYAELAENLGDKLNDVGFRADLESLIVATPEGYEIFAAADLVMEELGTHLDHAPPRAEITGGAWRA